MTRSLYQHPLAYVIGLEGPALLRAYSGVYDREFTLARFRELRDLLDAELGDGAEATPIETPRRTSAGRRSTTSRATS